MYPASNPARIETKRGHGISSDPNLHRAGLLGSEAGKAEVMVRLDPPQIEQGSPRRCIHGELLAFAVDANFVVADRCGDIGLDVQGLDH